MNSLKTTDLGGHPIFLDDLRWIETSFKDALKGIVNHVSPTDVMILSGCKYNSVTFILTGNLVMPEGYVFYNGEVFKVPAISISAAGGVLYWDLKVTYDPSGNKTFEDSSTHDVYEVREFEIKQAPTLPVGKVQVLSEKNIFKVYIDNIRTIPEGGFPFTSYESGFSTNFGYKRVAQHTIDDRTCLDIVIDGVPSGGFSGKVATIDNKYKPISEDAIMPISIIDIATKKQISSGTLIVFTNGDVNLYCDGYATPASGAILVNGSYKI